MTAILSYLLKVVICSGILFLYYHLALRNKAFHQWNRFYLMLSVFLSLLLPLLQFTFVTEVTDADDPWLLLQSLQTADNTLEEFVVVSEDRFPPEQWLLLAFGLVSLVLFTRHVLSLLRVRQIIRSHQVQKVDNINFVNTSVSGTPFSFFNYIFWNRDISLQTPTGQQIFQHEKVHVLEKHTLDKLLLQSVLVFFWCNPFFWLIRKELYFIHEFIADQKAVQNKDAAEFAAMILQAIYPQQFSSLTNPFFQKSIKRRIAMLTKKQKPGVQYIGRILALPLIAMTAFAFTVRTEAAAELNAMLNDTENFLPTLLQSGNVSLETDTVPKKKDISTVDVKKNPEKKVSEITITYTDGTIEKMTGNEAEKKGLINNAGYGNTKQVVIAGKDVRFRDSSKAGQEPQYMTPEPLYILDGKEISKAEMNQINPNQIESIDVLKDQSAIGSYGEKGKNGVILIRLKKEASDKPELREVIVQGYGTKRDKPESRDVIVEGYETKKDKPELREVIVQGYGTKRDKPQNREVIVEGKPRNPGGDPDDNKIFVKTEKPATVNPQQWRSHLEKNLQPIIEAAVANGAKAGVYTVNVRFIVHKDGSISDVRALNDPGYGMGTGSEETVRKGPKWNPAKQNGKVVTAEHTQPITFVISGRPTTKAENNIKRFAPQDLQTMTMQKLAGLSSSDEIVSVTLSLDNDEGDIDVVNNKGNYLNEYAKRLLLSAKKGRLLSLDEIVVRRNGSDVKLPSKAYRL